MSPFFALASRKLRVSVCDIQLTQHLIDLYGLQIYIFNI